MIFCPSQNALSLYIHIPWCVQKCPYCDFNSHAIRQDTPQEITYINALIQDFESHLSLINDREILSIFIGGGTPSLFSAQSIERLLKEIKKRCIFKNDIEITLEANPNSAEQKKFKRFLEAGVNRLSVGVQSFNHEHLKKLGRVHSSNEAKKALDAAFNAGFKRINADIMYGLPAQTIEQSLSDLKTLVSFNPEHISWYQLTLEENTPFYHSPPVLPNEDNCFEMQTIGQQYLTEAGYEQYEISAYCKNAQVSLHNVNYWEFGDYLGIGAGACSKITNAQGNVTRILNKKHPKHYLACNNDFIADKKIIPKSELVLEFMMNAMRLKKPIPLNLFEQRIGLSVCSISEKLNICQSKGWLNWSEKEITLTKKGYHFLNDVLGVFL